MKVFVNLRRDCRDDPAWQPDPSDKWDRANTHTDWEFVSLTTSQKDFQGFRSCAFNVPEDWKDKDLFVVWVVWSTGDSFGYDKDAYAEGVAVTDSVQEALIIKDAIEQDNKDNKKFDFDHPSLKILGREIYTNAWKGYFESLSNVRVESVRIS